MCCEKGVSGTTAHVLAVCCFLVCERVKDAASAFLCSASTRVCKYISPAYPPLLWPALPVLPLPSPQLQPAAAAKSRGADPPATTAGAASRQQPEHMLGRLTGVNEVLLLTTNNAHNLPHPQPALSVFPNTLQPVTAVHTHAYQCTSTTHPPVPAPAW